MEYKNLVKDFTDRTEHNLKVIESLKKQDQNVFEVTQLINSLLGLLILPQQIFFDSIPNDSIPKSKENGWLIPDPIEGYKQVKTLSIFLRYLRNGVAHFNIEFISDNEKITGLKIWNKPPKSRINWKIKLGLNELKSITSKLNELLRD